MAKSINDRAKGFNKFIILYQQIKIWHLIVTAFLFLSLTGISPDFANCAPLPGQIIVDPNNPAWLKYNEGGPSFISGPGDPEDFLYRGSRNSDGTRDGDQMELINKLKTTGANCIYLMAVRSHGGDGDASQNPFIDSDPSKGLDEVILNQWETWFTEMDNNGILIFFIFYDDSAGIWNTGDSVGSDERSFIQNIVNRFEHHRHLIWCVAEEYQEKFTAQRIKNIAAEIRAADDHDHVIAVHKTSGLNFSEFADDPNIDQFAIQYNVSTAAALHEGIISAWSNAANRYNLNMAEAAGMGAGIDLRKKSWAIAMAGAYVMVLKMDIKNTAIEDLETHGRMVSFFESTNFNKMAPNDELKFGGTEYVLAMPGDSYIAYASNLSGKMGLKEMIPGSYDFRWYDIANNTNAIQDNVTVNGGDQTWTKPDSFGSELVLYVKRADVIENRIPSANNQSVFTTYDTSKEITLNYIDSDGPGPYTFIITKQTSHGTLDGIGANLVYTPDSGFLGSDDFEWRVNDGIDDSNIATITIEVIDNESLTPPVRLRMIPR